MRVEHLGPPAAPLGVAQVHPRRSPANSADSSPPSPDLTSSTTSSASCGSRGTSSSASRCSSSWIRARAVGLVGESRVLGGELAGGGQVAAERLQLARGADHRAELGVAPAELAGLAWSACTAGSASARSSSAYSASSSSEPRCVCLHRAHRAHLRARHGHRRSQTTAPAGTRRRPPRRAPSEQLLGSPCGRACRSAPRSGRPGHRCPGSSACPCRTGGSWSRPRP